MWTWFRELNVCLLISSVDHRVPASKRVTQSKIYFFPIKKEFYFFHLSHTHSLMPTKMFSDKCKRKDPIVQKLEMKKQRKYLLPVLYTLSTSGIFVFTQHTCMLP